MSSEECGMTLARQTESQKRASFVVAVNLGSAGGCSGWNVTERCAKRAINGCNAVI